MQKRTVLVVAMTLFAGTVIAAPGPGPAIGDDNETDAGNETGFGNMTSGQPGPPGFVSDLLSGIGTFLGDLFSSLPVPDFVKGMFGGNQSAVGPGQQ